MPEQVPEFYNSGIKVYGETLSNFNYVGSRNYVQGVSVIAAMCRALWGIFSPSPLWISPHDCCCLFA